MINSDWREQGDALIMVLATAPGQTPVHAMFVVDTYCVGLKDAWGYLNVTGDDFLASLHVASRHYEMEMVPCDPALARELVVGGVRLAHENGFRLPREYQRWTSVLGGVEDWPTADLRYFGKDGEYLWIGPLEELENRLVGTSVEEFLAREDVNFLAPMTVPGDEFEDWVEEEEDADRLPDLRCVLARNLADQARPWLLSRGIIPHPRLEEAAGVFLDGVLSLLYAMFDSEEGASEVLEEASRPTLGEYSLDEARQVEEGCRQLVQFAETFKTAEDFFRALGIDFDDDEPEDAAGAAPPEQAERGLWQPVIHRPGQ